MNVVVPNLFDFPYCDSGIGSIDGGLRSLSAYVASRYDLPREHFVQHLNSLRISCDGGRGIPNEGWVTITSSSFPNAVLQYLHGVHHAPGDTDSRPKYYHRSVVTWVCVVHTVADGDCRYERCSDSAMLIKGVVKLCHEIRGTITPLRTGVGGVIVPALR